MTNQISRPGSKRLRMRKAYIGLFVIAAMAFGAFGASAASAHGVTAHAAKTSKAKYKATKKLTDTKSGKPKLSVKVSDNVKGGRAITKVRVTLPKDYAWNKGKLKHDLTVKNHKFTHAVKGRTLTITPKAAAKALAITVKRGGISETKRARAAKAGKAKVKLSVTEVKAKKTTINPSTLVTALKSIESALSKGQTTAEGSLNSVSGELFMACPGTLGQLDSAIASNPQSRKVTDSLLTTYDEFLLTSLPAMLSTYQSIDKLLTPLGYTSGQPLADLEVLAALPNATLGLSADSVCKDIKAILTTDTQKTLKSLENTTESQINAYAGDVTNLQAGLTKLEATLQGLISGGSSVLSASQLTTLTNLISGISTDLEGSLGAASSSNPLSSALTGLLSNLGLSSLVGTGGSTGTDPLSGITTILSDLGLTL